MRRVRRPLLALVALLVALAVGYAVRGTDGSSGGSGRHTTTSTAAPPSTSAGVPLSSLPPQVAQTVTLIERGGPFPYPHNDGVTFHNNEHHLPAEPDGYYREYTVPTPGSDDRGARRLIVGRDRTYWYTSDHYDSFQPVDLDR